MRDLDVKCDNCGAQKPSRLLPPEAQAKTWWTLDDIGTLGRTGTLDFCSLPCVIHFINHDDIRRIFAADFVMPAGEPGKITVPLRYRVVRFCKRFRVLRWAVQVLIVRVA